MNDVLPEASAGGLDVSEAVLRWVVEKLGVQRPNQIALALVVHMLVECQINVPGVVDETGDIRVLSLEASGSRYQRGVPCLDRVRSVGITIGYNKVSQLPVSGFYLFCLRARTERSTIERRHIDEQEITSSLSVEGIHEVEQTCH